MGCLVRQVEGKIDEETKSRDLKKFLEMTCTGGDITGEITSKKIEV